MGRVLVVVSCAVILAGCFVSDTSETTVPPPDLDGATEVELRTRAWLRACDDMDCRDGLVFGYFETPPPVQTAITEALGKEVKFQTPAERHEMESHEAVPDGAVSLAEGLPKERRADVVEVVVIVGELGREHGTMRVFLFQWDGTSWVDTTDDEVGVVTTTAVP